MSPVDGRLHSLPTHARARRRGSGRFSHSCAAPAATHRAYPAGLRGLRTCGGSSMRALLGRLLRALLSYFTAGVAVRGPSPMLWVRRVGRAPGVRRAIPRPRCGSAFSATASSAAFSRTIWPVPPRLSAGVPAGEAQARIACRRQRSRRRGQATLAPGPARGLRVEGLRAS